MKLAFFDAKSYDRPGFDRYASDAGVEIKYYEANLNIDTVSLAAGFDAVCVFVNDIVSADVVEKLHKLGVKAILLRCAGFNNVDIEKNEMRVLAIMANISLNTLVIPKEIKAKSRQLASPEAQMYFEYKNRYPTFSETII